MNKNNKILANIFLICFIFTNLVQVSIVTGSSVSKDCIACESKVKECSKVLRAISKLKKWFSNNKNEIDDLLGIYEYGIKDRDKYIRLKKEDSDKVKKYKSFLKRDPVLFEKKIMQLYGEIQVLRINAEDLVNPDQNLFNRLEKEGHFINILKNLDDKSKKICKYIFLISERIIEDLIANKNKNKELLNKKGLKYISKKMIKRINKACENNEALKNLLLHIAKNIKEFHNVSDWINLKAEVGSGSYATVALDNSGKYAVKRNETGSLDLFKQYLMALTASDKDANLHKAFFIHQKKAYLVMDYHKKDLLMYLKDNVKNMSFQEKCSLINKIFNAVESMHNKGVVHRDLKPENIMVIEKNGKIEIRIIDYPKGNFHGTESSVVRTVTYATSQKFDNNKRYDIACVVNMIWQIFSENSNHTFNVIAFLIKENKTEIKYITENTEKKEEFKQVMKDENKYLELLKYLNDSVKCNTIKQDFFNKNKNKMNENVYNALIDFTKIILLPEKEDIEKMDMDYVRKQFKQTVMAA